jgi:hypothetical protein
MKKIIQIIILLVFLDIVYSNSEHYISQYLWKQVNYEGELCSDNLIFDSCMYERKWPYIYYYGRNNQDNPVGYYIFCINYVFESRLWIYSFKDNGYGVYKNVIPME